MTLKEAVEILLRQPEHIKARQLNWAVNYAKELHRMILARVPAVDLRTQILYLQGNLSSWRGDEAKAVRAAIDKWLKENK